LKDSGAWLFQSTTRVSKPTTKKREISEMNHPRRKQSSTGISVSEEEEMGSIFTWRLQREWNWRESMDAISHANGNGPANSNVLFNQPMYFGIKNIKCNR